jgi:hypothetical protein
MSQPTSAASTHRRWARAARRFISPVAAAAALVAATPAGAVDYFWGSGYLTGSGLPGAITLNDTLTLGCWVNNCGGPILDTAFTNNGVINATTNLYFVYNMALTNGWQTQLQGDVGLLDYYAGGWFVNESSGSLVKTAGTGSSNISINSVSRGGSILDAMTGTINFTAGSANFESGAILKANTGTSIVFSGGNANFADGVKLFGDGQFNIGVGGTYGGSIGATNLAFTGGALMGGDGSAGSHATLTSNASMSGNVTLRGAWTVAAGQTLAATGAGSRVIDGVVTNLGTITTDNHLYFLYGHSLDNQGSLQLQGDVGLLESYAGGLVTNSGTLAKTAGAGTSLISGIGFVNNGGLIDVQTGTLQFANAASFQDGTRFIGAGSVLLSAGSNFTGSIQSANLVLGGGHFTGGDGTAASRPSFSGVTQWQGGNLSGQWLLASDHTLNITAGPAKLILGTVTNQGVINQADHLYFQYGNLLDNQGTLKLQGDVDLADNYASGVITNSGTLAKTAGTGTSTINHLTTAVGSTGVVDVQTGRLVFQSGSNSFAAGATLKVAAGSEIAFQDGATRFEGTPSLLGDGQYTLAGNSRIVGNFGAKNLAFTAGNHIGGDGSAGSAGSGATLTSNATWTGSGNLQGVWTIAAGKTLSMQGAGSRAIYGSVTNLGTIHTDAPIYFYYGNAIDNQGRIQLQGDVGLADAYAGGVVTNSGTLAKTAGTGTSTVSGVGFVNTGGQLDVQTGTLKFTGYASFYDGTRFTGAGTSLLSGGALLMGNIHTSNLALAGGNFSGGDGSAGANATLQGHTRWTGGSLSGRWVLPAAQTLAIEAGNTKILNGSFTNQGQMQLSDNLYFQYGNTIDNQGRLLLQGDVGLVNYYAGGVVTNSGTLAKTAGTGTSAIDGVYLVSNGGTIDVQTGTLAISSGGTYYDGSRFTGAGNTVISAASTFVGNIHSSNLRLTGASFNGGDGGAASVATLHGSTRWDSGNLQQQWVLAADHTLDVQAGGTKMILGTVTNQGTLNQADNLYFQYGHVLDNQGTLHLQGDVGMVNYYAGGVVYNSGTLAKTAGTGESDLSGIYLVNTGTLDARTGTLRLPANFSNDGRLMGLGHFAAGQIINNGHLAPGASPGTLTLDSHLVLGDAGSFDVELQDAAHHDLLNVNGNVTLGGTLALSCYGACNFVAGTDLLVLDATGSLSGAFSQVSFTGLDPAAFHVVVDQANADVWVHVDQNVSAVPEPETWALMLAGVAGVLALARRRREALAND